MNEQTLRELLSQVQGGDVDIDAALTKLRHLPFEPMGFANIDHHRALRCGFPEVIYCPGKTPEQVGEIFDRLAVMGGNVLATRADEAHYAAVIQRCSQAVYDTQSRTITLRTETAEPVGHVAIVAAGTSDLPVASEAKITAEMGGARVTTHYDVGVAGLHRLLAASEELQQAKVVVVTAGMEGALASVVGGLVGVPVIAVPTSVGYGASFQGLAALLSMLNSCSSNVSVVNIDNGFSGGYIAAMINRQSK
jgi:pyridinium-3,5-biscarboxylic acid mononucleotide synthase